MHHRGHTHVDPATLYIVFQMANGTVRPMERAFVDAAVCEEYVGKVIKPRTDIATVVRYECVSLEKMQSAPSWYRQYTPVQKVIQGVPLDLEYQP